MSQDGIRAQVAPHVIVVGNEKGGTGKTTLAMHLAVALVRAGQQVATVDADTRQRSLTHWIDNRRDWFRRQQRDVVLPSHICLPQIEANTRDEVGHFEQELVSLRRDLNFVVIDTPSREGEVVELAHSMADTLVSPINNSFVDIDVLASVDPVTFAVRNLSHYAQAVREARRRRRSVDGMIPDWIVVRNRIAPLGSRKDCLISRDLNELSLQLGFRWLDGLAERRIYRELFPCGLTALDDSEVQGISGLYGTKAAARSEVEAFVGALRLPIDERGYRRAKLRRAWFLSHETPLEPDELLHR
jgi:chromosome partitioning protein